MNDATTQTVPSVRFEGVEISMGGKTWIVPPLNLKQVRTLMPVISKIRMNAEDELVDDEALVAAVQVAHAALSRNYPELTRDEVEELLDMGNIRTVIPAVMAIAGLEKKPAGEA